LALALGPSQPATRPQRAAADVARRIAACCACSACRTSALSRHAHGASPSRPAGPQAGGDGTGPASQPVPVDGDANHGPWTRPACTAPCDAHSMACLAASRALAVCSVQCPACSVQCPACSAPCSRLRQRARPRCHPLHAQPHRSPITSLLQSAPHALAPRLRSWEHSNQRGATTQLRKWALPMRSLCVPVQCAPSAAIRARRHSWCGVRPDEVKLSRRIRRHLPVAATQASALRHHPCAPATSPPNPQKGSRAFL
jgi:hypothetical protein